MSPNIVSPLRRCRFPLALLLFLPMAASAQTTRYVWTNSPTPTLPFTSWATAARTIQDAVDVASAGDWVKVTNGVYSTDGRAAPGMLLTNRVMIPTAITVQSVNGPGVTTIRGQGPFGLAAVRCAYLTNGATLSGFRIENGRTDIYFGFSPIMDKNGGGALAFADCVLTNCHVVSNQAVKGAGGIYGINATVVDCLILHNVSPDGGGVFLQGGTLLNCDLHNNMASPGFGFGYGGGAYVVAGEVVGCTFVSNNGSWGGGLTMEGGSASDILCVSNTAVAGAGIAAAETLISDSRFYHNSAYDHGGGAYLEMCWITGSVVSNNNLAWQDGVGGAAHGAGIASWASTIKDCEIRNNWGFDGDDLGGGISCQVVGAWTTRVENCSIRGNSAGNGGGIFVFPSAICHLYTSGRDTTTVRENSATHFGGGICVDTQGVFIGSGGLHIAANLAVNGGGLAAWAGAKIDIQEADAYIPLLYGNIASDSGGGLFATGTLSEITLRMVQVGWADETVQGNQAQGTNTFSGGGGIALYGGASLYGIDLIMEYNECPLGSGGGLLVKDSQAALISTASGTPATAQPTTLFAHNRATNKNGGGIYVFQSQISIQDSSFYENAAKRGGAIHTDSGSTGFMGNVIMAYNDASVSGGGMRVYEAGLSGTGCDLRQCTLFSNNTEGISYGGGATFSLTNCIVRGNGGTQVTPGVSVGYSDIQGGYPGIGNIDAPPFFMNTATPNFHLTIDSTGTVVDAGTDAGLTNDCVFRARPQSGGFDMGAFEYNPGYDDFDGDTMTDAWELDHGLDPRNPADGNIYSDLDPVLNRDEFTADTDPFNSDDYFQLTDCVYHTNHPERGILVGFPSSSKRLYSLTSTDALSNECVWAAMPEQTNILGIGGADGLNDTNAPSAYTARTYRVTVSIPPE